MNDFSRRLKELRTERGLTQLQLSEALGYRTYTVITNWESGRQIADIENLKKLSIFFNVSIDYLVGNEN